nr:retrovirus-related Pol polyprotein from transposon TNT 1-94 [Tanacetum cinerariifolium]
MWENIELLMKGYGLSEERKQEELFDEYEHFRAIGNESIHEYFIRFHKLANDLKITKIKIPTHQQNTNVDPLAYLTHSSKHQTSTIVASPTSTSSSTLAPEQQAQSGSDAMMATMQQLFNLLSGFQKQFPPMNNQLRTSSNPRSTKGNQVYSKKTDRNGKKVICYNCRGEGHVARECKEPKRAKDTQYYKDKMMLSDAKDKAAFMVNFSSTEEANGTSSNKINEVHSNASDSYNSDTDDNTMPYQQYLLLTKAVVPPTKKPSETHYVPPGEMYLQDQITAIIPQLEGHIKTNKDLRRANESLKAELAQCKLKMQSLEQGTVPQKELSYKQVYWQSASVVKALFVHTRPAKKNATLKARVKGKQNSRPTQPEKPKVLTPGMFVICTSKNAARTTSQWKPTGRTFSLYATYPLTRIAKPLTEPLDQTQSVSPSTNASRISKFPDSNLRDRKAGSEGITSGTDSPLVFGFMMLKAYDRTLNELSRKDLVRGLPRLKYDKEHLCPSCQLGKSKKSSHPLKTVNTNTEILNTLHMDLCGPLRVESINKKKYILVIVDDYTRFCWVQFLRTKDETPEAIKKFIKTTQVALNTTVRFVRTIIH